MLKIKEFPISYISLCADIAFSFTTTAPWCIPSRRRRDITNSTPKFAYFQHLFLVTCVRNWLTAKYLGYWKLREWYHHKDGRLIFMFHIWFILFTPYPRWFIYYSVLSHDTVLRRSATSCNVLRSCETNVWNFPNLEPQYYSANSIFVIVMLFMQPVLFVDTVYG